MKRKIVLICSLLGSCLPTIIYADNQTTIGYQVDPTYTVSIPESTTLTFLDSQESFGNITIENALLDEGKCIRVSVLSDNYMVNSNGDKLPYEIIGNDTSFQYADFTTTGETQNISIKMDESIWKKAPSGTYTSEIGFHIIYVDINAPYVERSISESSIQKSTITAIVPDTHNISLNLSHATLEGEDGEIDDTVYTVKRLSSPTFKIHVEEGYELSKVLVDDVDITDKVKNGTFTLESINNDQTITVETIEEEPKPTETPEPTPTPSVEPEPTETPEPSPSTSTESEKKEESTKTGIHIHVVLYGSVLLVSLIGIVMIIVKRKKQM